MTSAKKKRWNLKGVVLGSGVLAVLAIGAVGSVFVGQRLLMRWFPPSAGADVGEEPAAWQRARENFRGRIVWSTNRSGSHEVVLLDLRGRKPTFTALTAHPHVDTYPRFSPDGRSIVFNRSREPWVSARNPEPWDVWLMAADGSNPRHLAAGFHASFTPDGREVVFGRGAQVVAHEVASGTERIVYDAGTALGAGGAFEPDLGPGGLAVTFRPRPRAFGVVDLTTGAFTSIDSDGCQILWWPGTRRITWMEAHAGNGGTHVMTGEADGSDRRVLMDLPGPRSHEYFPKLDPTGTWMVHAASLGGHEHDRADYEVHLWKIGEPWDSAIQLSHHTGNDQWPDVRVD